MRIALVLLIAAALLGLDAAGAFVLPPPPASLLRAASSPRPAGRPGRRLRRTPGGDAAAPTSAAPLQPYDAAGRGGMTGKSVRVAVRRGMFEFGGNAADFDGRGGSEKGGCGGGGWKVPRSAVEALGRGDAAAASSTSAAAAPGADAGNNGGEEFLPFEFELTKGPTATRRNNNNRAVVRGSFYFPGQAEEAEAGKGTAAASVGGTTTRRTSDAPPSRVVVRHLRESDLPPVVDMCVDEFGSYSSPLNDPFRRAGDAADGGGDGYVVVNNGNTDLSLGKILEPLWTKYENWAFSWVVRVGLFMRIVRSREGLEGEAPHDHNVLCLVETPTPPSAAGDGKSESGGKRRGEEVVAIAELSLQPPDPVRNAPPYVLPLSAKRAICRRGGFGEPRAYVSNVLVRPDRRGYGYGRAIMAACEGLARSWGCDDVSLHVDADASSGRAAQGLYRALGYVGVADEGRGVNGDRAELRWMGPEMAKRGLYVVEGVPLLYLRKNLRDR